MASCKTCAEWTNSTSSSALRERDPNSKSDEIHAKAKQLEALIHDRVSSEVVFITRCFKADESRKSTTNSASKKSLL